MRYKATPKIEKPGSSVVVPMVDTNSSGKESRKKKSSLMALQTILIIHIILGIHLLLEMVFVSIKLVRKPCFDLQYL